MIRSVSTLVLAVCLVAAPGCQHAKAQPPRSCPCAPVCKCKPCECDLGVSPTPQPGPGLQLGPNDYGQQFLLYYHPRTGETYMYDRLHHRWFRWHRHRGWVPVIGFGW